MKRYFCPRQKQAADAVRSAAWPEACDPGLRAHVETCETCSDVVLVTQALGQARHEALQYQAPKAPALPSAGILWWRAQIRRRNAALERMTRPVVVAEKIALLIMLLAAVALVAWQREQLSSWLSGVWEPLANVAQVPGLLMLGFATLVIFGGFAVYLLRAKE